jgi:CheY-like chemotaxis protein
VGRALLDDQLIQAERETLSAATRIRTIVGDLMMPTMTGFDFYAALTQQRPDDAQRVVFITGGTISAETALSLDALPNPRVEKPFDLGSLRALVAQRLSPLEALPPDLSSDNRAGAGPLE